MGRSTMASQSSPGMEPSVLHYNPQGLGINWSSDTEPRQRQYTVYHNAAWFRMLFLAIFLLIFSALLAGLTLAICGLDPTWVELRSTAGTAKERKRAFVVKRLKQNGTWMLCSLIICSVACGESLPIVVQGLWHGPDPWVPILVSTLGIGIFGEILPQYIIPRHALAWGYYCWPVIATCMWLTGIISYPLALVLDLIFKRCKKDPMVLTGDQLGALITSHERGDEHGGKLGKDATRVMLGALNLDGRRIDRVFSDHPEQLFVGEEKDIEKAERSVVHGMVVSWYAVHTIDINEPVDRDFIDKVRGWSYSRIPVLDKSDPGAFKGIKIFGFLHIKNLVGLDIKAKQVDGSELRVKDLPLYPLPIIRESMSVYELLNMFQLGMSRIAVVIPSDSDAGSSHYNTVDSRLAQSLHWTAPKKSVLKIESSSDSDDQTLQFLEAAKANIEGRGHRILSIRSPTPIGIITFEDIIDTILQKTSRDEKDYFDRGHELPLTKTRKTGDCNLSPKLTSGLPKIFTPKSERAVLKKPPKEQGIHDESVTADRAQNLYRNPVFPGTVRKRNVSRNEKVVAADGADDDHSHSSYTQNSQGGFHGSESNYSSDNGVPLMHNNITELRNCSSSNVPGNPYSHVTTGSSSVPSRKADRASGALRHVSAAPRIPNTLRRVTPFSRDNHSSYERMVEAEAQTAGLALPSSTIVKIEDPTKVMEPPFDSGNICLDTENLNNLDSILENAREGHRSSSGETPSFSSWYGKLQLDEEDPHKDLGTGTKRRPHANSQGERLFPSRSQSQTSDIAQPYDGFPPELLELEYDKENRIANYVSKTLPRMPRLSASEHESTDTPSRERSFHDDRALLPSQLRALNDSDMDAGGVRSSSLWF